jgi:hypothetical protein
MSNLTIRLRDHSFHIPKKPVIENSELFDAYPDLYDEPLYEIQSDVDVEDCGAFVTFLQNRDESLVTTDNCQALRELALEFGDAYLLDVCEKQHAAQQIENLIARVSALENSVGQQGEDCESLERDFPRSLCEFVAGELRRLSEEVRGLRQETDDRFLAISSKVTSDRAEMATLIESLGSELREAIAEIKSGTDEGLKAARESVRRLEETTENHYVKLLNKVQCPMRKAKSLDGIISYLTKKHGGNVHEEGIVTITAASLVGRCDVQNVADLTSDSDLVPGQWVCWDFREMRVQPTHYTIEATLLIYWALEGSLDDISWTEIDRRWDTEISSNQNRTSFAVSKQGKFRFIRLTQAVNAPVCTPLPGGLTLISTPIRGPDPGMAVRAVEFFGTLFE